MCISVRCVSSHEHIQFYILNSLDIEVKYIKKCYIFGFLRLLFHDHSAGMKIHYKNMALNFLGFFFGVCEFSFFFFVPMSLYQSEEI